MRCQCVLRDYLHHTPRAAGGSVQREMRVWGYVLVRVVIGRRRGRQRRLMPSIRRTHWGGHGGVAELMLVEGVCRRLAEEPL